MRPDRLLGIVAHQRAQHALVHTDAEMTGPEPGHLLLQLVGRVERHEQHARRSRPGRLVSWRLRWLGGMRRANAALKPRRACNPKRNLKRIRINLNCQLMSVLVINYWLLYFNFWFDFNKLIIYNDQRPHAVSFPNQFNRTCIGNAFHCQRCLCLINADIARRY